MTSVQLIGKIHGALATTGDPKKAVRKQAYMKSALPFHGVQPSEMRCITKRLPKEHPLASHDQWERAVRESWDEVTYREHWHAVLEIAGHRDACDWQDLGALELYRYPTTTGAWWDVVDGIASPLVEDIVATAPGARAAVRDQATGDDLWLHHISIIYQLQHKTFTDLELLGHAIDSNLEGSQHGSELSIRRTVGWALRQHTRVDPDQVKAFVETRGSRFSGLGHREVLEHL